MSCYVRLMRKEDIAPVTEIDREAFPTEWPPPNFPHELQNRLAHYIVACDEEKLVEQPKAKASSENSLTRLMSRLKQLFSRDYFSSNELSPLIGHYIIGFVGFWVMADEAHITSIAVRETHRRQGIGELLLISVIDLATELKARIVALEVRTSNTAAQSLYSRYGFTKVRVRPGYYTDNREDGVVMSTENITSAPFQAHLQQLKQAHSRKYGITLYQIAR
ncbi:ribosomal protein S18-alanine N-acetyltransferase [Chloroflexota bacterium]